MPIFRKFTDPERIPTWFDNDISAHHLVCRRCETPGQAIIPICSTCNISVFTHLKQKVANTKYNSSATNDSLFFQMRNAQKQLIHVEQLLKNLQATRRVLKEFITIRQFKVAPIMNLSRELLVSIFEFLGPSNNIASTRSIYPLILGQVCRDFRTIVLGTPHLWSSILIMESSPQRMQSKLFLQADIKSMTKRLQLCAKRSGDMLMDLTVWSWPGPHVGLSRILPTVSSEFFQCLSILIPRLRLIKVGFGYFMTDWVYAQLTLAQTSFPNLQDYTIQGPDGFNISLSFLRGALRLEQLHVNRLSEDLRLVDVVHSHQVKSLTGCMSLRTLTDFPLENLQRLELSDAWSFSATLRPPTLFPILEVA
ncbi:hypothetical protein DL96DRAFT_1756217 [Flagelloscypha sp. PMI_526]|nr:hypothetical protein DL96DRAFT_1756217 [Flagelloscypha sp. PMI_526]